MNKHNITNYMSYGVNDIKVYKNDKLNDRISHNSNTVYDTINRILNNKMSDKTYNTTNKDQNISNKTYNIANNTSYTNSINIIKYKTQ